MGRVSQTSKKLKGVRRSYLGIIGGQCKGRSVFGKAPYRKETRLGKEKQCKWSTRETEGDAVKKLTHACAEGEGIFSEKARMLTAA